MTDRPVTAAELHDGFVRVIDADHHADFHLRWLRHNCELDRHPATGERLTDSAALPDALVATEATIDDGVLRVRWAHDQRVSRFPLAWLRRHAYAIDRVAVPRPRSDLRTLELDGTPGPAAVVDALLARVDHHGAAVVRREYATPEAETAAWIAALESRGLGVIASHAGRIEDLRTDTTNAHTDQLGYTDAAIDLHTDQPFLDEPPRYQLVQGVRVADTGGETVLADGAAAFRYLASHDAEAADRLLHTPVRFHRKQRQLEREVVAPIVTQRDGRLRVRVSYFTMAPFQLAFDRMAGWYRAYDQLVRILRDPAHHVRFQLRPGDVVVYDNHRMLHGRTAFRGPRWVRGVYIDNTTARAGCDLADLDASG
ncbi:MAG TPA: TauD/TfdA family dioxygenase [Kofleriaceae bacterium]|nr:TauD/TfdA family dioxygenase [Kofleriaceae bacterium]